MMGTPGNQKEKQPFDLFGNHQDETHHQVTLTKGFYMGVYTVTQEQWQAVMGQNPSHFKGGKNLPVDSVSWDDCHKFIKALREKDRKPYRMPTEAEWEYACQAGTTTVFHFGEAISTKQANFRHSDDSGLLSGGGAPAPVGSFPPNAFGLHEMHGNIREWCQDWLGDYPQQAVIDPKGPAQGTTRVLRGGSWSSTAQQCRSAYRDGGLLANQSNCINVSLRICFFAE